MIEHDNLEEFADPANYDLEDDSDTGVGFYAALAREAGAPVLELACGTGRVSIPLARAGIPVTGLDIVPGMLEQARSKSVGMPARWVQGDARSFDLNEKFRLIFLTGNAFQAFLTDADQNAVLDRVAAHLHEDGLFAFEVRNPSNAANSGTPDSGLFARLETRLVEEEWQTYTDSSGRAVRVSKTQCYDAGTEILEWTTYRRWLDGGVEQTRTTRIAVRFMDPDALAARLVDNGFEIVRQYGDWDLSPSSSTSRSIILVCRNRSPAV